jgi:hypothetical protein
MMVHTFRHGLLTFVLAFATISFVSEPVFSSPKRQVIDVRC